MDPTRQQEVKQGNKITGFERFLENLGWLQIFSSPFLIGLVISAIVYLSKPGTTRLVIALLILIAGISTGVAWANKIWKKNGTIYLVSKTMASPELDNTNEDSPGKTPKEQE